MSIQNPTARWRLVLSLLALAFLLSAHAVIGAGTVPEVFGLAAGMVLLVLLARSSVANAIGWPIGRR